MDESHELSIANNVHESFQLIHPRDLGLTFFHGHLQGHALANHEGSL